MSKIQVRELSFYLDTNHWDFDLQDADNAFAYMDFVELEDLPEEVKNISTANNSGMRYFLRIGNGKFHSYTKQNGFWYREKEVYSNRTIYSVLYEPKIVTTFEQYKECKKVDYKVIARLPELNRDMAWWTHQIDLDRIGKQTWTRK